MEGRPRTKKESVDMAIFPRILSWEMAGSEKRAGPRKRSGENNGGNPKLLQNHPSFDTFDTFDQSEADR